MSTPTEILSPPDAAALEALLLGYLQEASDPITDWNSGAVRLTQLKYLRLALTEFISGVVPGMAGSAFFETASSDDWVDLIAEQLFHLTRVPATLTQQSVKLTCDGTHGPFTITAGMIVVATRTANRYRLTGGGTLSTGGTLTVTAQAEGPNDSALSINYSDGPTTIAALDPPLAGVTVSNAAPSFSPVISTPSPAAGLGVVTVSGTPPGDATVYDLEIISDGQNTTATFRYRANGGQWSVAATMAATFTIPATSITVAFGNDAGGASPSFITGDVYTFTAPGSPITQQGVDAESSAALASRCLALWADISAALVEDKRAKWAKAASASVKRVRVDRDTTYPGRMLVTIAGAAGTSALSGGIVATVQRALDEQEGIGRIPLVAAATITTITAGGLVLLPAAQLSIVQTIANLAWAKYVNNAAIGSVVRIAELLQALMDAGATDVVGLTLDSGGGPVAGNVALATNAVAQAVSIVSTLTWQTTT
jgi:hypothetical protein